MIDFGFETVDVMVKFVDDYFAFMRTNQLDKGSMFSILMAGYFLNSGLHNFRINTWPPVFRNKRSCIIKGKLQEINLQL